MLIGIDHVQLADTAPPGVRRAHLADPFGDRLELIAADD